MHLNRLAKTLCDQIAEQATRLRVGVSEVAGARILDFGVQAPGGLEAGCFLARICLGDAAAVSIVAADPARWGSQLVVQVQTDHPLWACLGGQYAGWPVQVGDFFAMGSGPMRMLRGREPMLGELQLVESSATDDTACPAVGVLESDRLPNEDVVHEVAQACGVRPESLTLCVAPVTSLAGTVQVVARSIETAMHKMHAVGISPATVISGFGAAPLPPVAGGTVAGIGRTNDAVLYGGQVDLWVDANDEELRELGPKIPSNSSEDHGRPFAEIFQAYEYDFYKVDPGLFSPAVVHFHNLRDGNSYRFGAFDRQVLESSFANLQSDPSS